MTYPGDTPLHSAIRSFEGDENPVKILLENDDSDINVRNSEGETPLLLAVRNECSPELIELLLNHGANVKATSPRDGNTALHLVLIDLSYATNFDWHTIANTLLKYGSDANARNLEGSIPLHLVAKDKLTIYGHIFMERLREVSDVNSRNSKGDTPLHLYMRNDKVSSYDKRDFLNNAGDIKLPVNVVNSKGETPLLLAVRSRKCDLALIKKFLVLGADVSITDATGENAYQAFCRAIADEYNKYRPEEILMSQTILRGSLQQHLSSSLHVACLFLNVESVRTLLRMGADVNDLDPFDRAPLCYAITYNSTPNNEDFDDKCSTVALMLDYGADVNQQREQPCFENDFSDYPETFLETIILWHPARHNLPTESSNLFLNVRDIFIQHATKLLALQEKQVERGINVQLLNERNRQLLNTYNKFGETGYKEWLSRCYEELQAMSETKIGDSGVSFYDLLVASAKKVEIYPKNKKLIEAFQAGKNMFLMYRGMLEAKIDKAIERRKLIDSAAVLLSDVLEFGLPSDEFYERTLSYFSNQDLIRIIGC